jgi:hypothetical protein
MITSTLINELAAALAKAQGEFSAAPKLSKNPHYKSNYADLAAVWSVIRKPLSENGLSVVQGAGTTEKGEIAISTRLVHTSGQWIESVLTLNPSKDDPQGRGSAITYGRRYGLAAMVGVVADEDDDANGAIDHNRAAFNKWVKDLLVAGKVSDSLIRTVIERNGGDYVAAKHDLERTLEESNS